MSAAFECYGKLVSRYAVRLNPCMRMRGLDLSESRLNCPFGGRVLLLFPLPQIQDYWYVVHAIHVR